MEFNAPISHVAFSLREASPHDAEYIPSETLKELRSIQGSHLRIGSEVRDALGVQTFGWWDEGYA